MNTTINRSVPKRCFYGSMLVLFCFYSLLVVPPVLFVTPVYGQPTHRTIRDMAGRLVKTPVKIDAILCSGAGCLRLATYLRCQHLIAGVDTMETRGMIIDARPYAIANPQYKKLPVFGELRGRDNLEQIISLPRAPQVIFKTCADKGESADSLYEKTNIPVVVLEYGNLTWDRTSLEKSLLLMGRITGTAARARELVTFFENMEADLKNRTQQIRPSEKPVCYVGGIGGSGPHGMPSTETAYGPFLFTSTVNAATPAASTRRRSKATIAKEQILVWDPDVIFLDVSTLLVNSSDSALVQLRTDPVYSQLKAVRNRRVYGVFPYNSYHHNFGSTYANAYFVGKTLYPDAFSDIEPMEKAESISIFLNGGPAYGTLKEQYRGLPFDKIPVSP